MRRISFSIATALSVVLSLEIGATGTQKIDVERELTLRLGFTEAEVAQARSGKAVAKLLPTKDGAEIGVVAAVRMNAKADRLVYWFKEIANFRKAAELGLSRRISDEPQIGDFADLSLDSDELAALRKCRPGNCDLLLGDKGIQQFQAVDWKAADVARRANLLVREMFLGYAQAYLKGGDEALGAIHNDKTPRVSRGRLPSAAVTVAGALRPRRAARSLPGRVSDRSPSRVGAVPVLGERRRRARRVNLVAPAGFLSPIRRRRLHRRQTAIREPLRRGRCNCGVAGVRTE